MDLKDEQWSVVEPLLPKRKRRKDGKGRPPTDQRSLLNGMLWILRTGAQWRDLPDRYPPYQTVHRWFQRWVDDDLLEEILHVIAEDLIDRGKLDLSETYLDGSFAAAKKGALKLVKRSGEKGPRSWLRISFKQFSRNDSSCMHSHTFETILKTPSLSPSLRFSVVIFGSTHDPSDASLSFSEIYD